MQQSSICSTTSNQSRYPRLPSLLCSIHTRPLTSPPSPIARHLNRLPKSPLSTDLIPFPLANVTHTLPRYITTRDYDTAFFFLLIMAKRKASAGTATTTARSKKAAKTSNTNNNRDSEPDRLVVDHRHESSSPNPQVPVDNIHYDNGPYPRQEYNHHNLHSLDIDPRLDIMNHHFHMGNDGTGSGGSMDAAMMGNTDEGDNRSRNAKAQRRHREKRKAHLKAVSPQAKTRR